MASCLGTMKPYSSVRWPLWLGLVLSGAAVAGAGAASPREPATLELVRRSDFIGVLHLQPLVSAPEDEWRQIVSVHCVDALKGALQPNPARNGELPPVYGMPAHPGPYYARYPGRGDYLVFLRRERDPEGERWVTTAAFHLDYRPDGNGRIEGRIVAGHQQPRSVKVATVRQLLSRVINGRTAVLAAARALDPVFKRASMFAARNSERSVPHNLRLREATILAAAIRRGTPRSDVEKVFPEEDGGISGPGSTRYYLGSQVMVEVPYDQSGGRWQRGNRVRGALRVYRSLPHYD